MNIVDEIGFTNKYKGINNLLESNKFNILEDRKDLKIYAKNNCYLLIASFDNKTFLSNSSLKGLISSLKDRKMIIINFDVNANRINDLDPFFAMNSIVPYSYIDNELKYNMSYDLSFNYPFSLFSCKKEADYIKKSKVEDLLSAIKKLCEIKQVKPVIQSIQHENTLNIDWDFFSSKERLLKCKDSFSMERRLKAMGFEQISGKDLFDEIECYYRQGQEKMFVYVTKGNMQDKLKEYSKCCQNKTFKCPTLVLVFVKNLGALFQNEPYNGLVSYAYKDDCLQIVEGNKKYDFKLTFVHGNYNVEKEKARQNAMIERADKEMPFGVLWDYLDNKIDKK